MDQKLAKQGIGEEPRLQNEQVDSTKRQENIVRGTPENEQT